MNVLDELERFQEAALRDGLPAARSCSQAEWRRMLLESECRIALPLR